MQKPTCSVPECTKESKWRGWCHPHYKRWHRTGSPTGSTRKTAEQRFWEKVDKTGECWEWTAFVMDCGYGQFQRSDGEGTALAHRFSYEITKGVIPEGIQIDHICFNRLCVRPEHLRPTTAKQNSEHKQGAQKNSSSGIRGVYWREDAKKWEVKVGHNMKMYHIGMYPTAAEAEAAAIAKRIELFTHNDVDRRDNAQVA